MTVETVHDRAGNCQSVVSRTVRNFLDIFVLEMLQNGSKHGYEMMRELETKTGTCVSPGTLYPLLYALEEKRFIAGTWLNSVRRDRRVYNITSTGQLYRQQALLSMGRLLPRIGPRSELYSDNPEYGAIIL